MSQMTGQPIIILKEGTERTSGKSAVERNIMVAVTLAEAIRTSLGPRGLDKMLVDGFNDCTITNDGATILKEMELQHPIAKFIAELAKTQDQEVGDGTTSVVVLAGELLRLALVRLNDNVHPTVIVEGYRKAAEQSIEFLKEIALNIEGNREFLINVANTSLSSKLVSTEGDYLADIVVRAALAVKEANKVDLDDIKIEKKTGESLRQTQLIQGILLDKDVVHSDMPKTVENAKIALIDDSIEIQKGEFDAELSITNPQQIKAFKSREADIISDMITKIVEAGANVVFCSKGIDDNAQSQLAKNNILAARRLKKSDIEKLAKATGAKIISNIKELSATDLGKAGVVEEQRVGTDKMIFVKECASPHAVTILIRGGTDLVIAEAERSLHDALCVVRDVIREPQVVYGGGSPEMAVSRKLKQFADKLGGREQLAVYDFAEALEVIPRTLAENTGLDALDTIANLRQSIGKKFTYGIDPETRSVKDFEGTNVIEPMAVKRQAYLSASEAAQMILRIDDIISSKGTGGGAGGAPHGGHDRDMDD